VKTYRSQVALFLGIILLAALILGTSCVPQMSVPPEGTLVVHIIDVGQADAIFLQFPEGKAGLVDAGNNADAQLVVEYLQGHGVSRLEFVVGTHPHEDHLGGLDAVIESFEVGSVYLPDVTHTTKTFEDVITAIEDKGLSITIAESGVNIDLGLQGLRAEFLAPCGSDYSNLNDYSAVLKLTFGSVSFLLTGDAEEASEEEMLASGADLRAAVLKVGHHGSHSSTSEDFLAAINPAHAIISVGTDNDYGHPHARTVDLLQSKGIRIYRTDLQGTIVFTTDGSGLTVNVEPWGG